MDEHEDERKVQLDKAIGWAKDQINPTNPATYSRDHGYWSGLSDAKKILGPGSPVAENPSEKKPEAEIPA